MKEFESSKRDLMWFVIYDTSDVDQIPERAGDGGDAWELHAERMVCSRVCRRCESRRWVWSYFPGVVKTIELTMLTTRVQNWLVFPHRNNHGWKLLFGLWENGKLVWEIDFYFRIMLKIDLEGLFHLKIKWKEFHKIITQIVWGTLCFVILQIPCRFKTRKGFKNCLAISVSTRSDCSMLWQFNIRNRIE